MTGRRGFVRVMYDDDFGAYLMDLNGHAQVTQFDRADAARHLARLGLSAQQAALLLAQAHAAPCTWVN